MPRGHRRSEPRRRATSSRARVPRRRDLGGLAPRAARRSLKSRASHPGARRRQTVDVAGKQRCETENAGPDGRVRRGVVHSPAGARAHRSPDEPRGSPPTPYQRRKTPCRACSSAKSEQTLHENNLKPLFADDFLFRARAISMGRSQNLTIVPLDGKFNYCLLYTSDAADE